MLEKRYLTSREVTERLEITPATLYSYVSRGLIRSETSPDDLRQRRYLAEDVQHLLDRKTQRQDPSQAVQQRVQQALHWGAPLMDSALTLITDGELYYRGQRVSELGQSARFEDVCGLLWLDEIGAADGLFASVQAEVSPLSTDVLTTSALSRMQIALAAAAENDLQVFDHSPQNVARTGVRIIRHMMQAATDTALHSGDTLAAAIAQGWGNSGQAEAATLINAALILCADHELNVSAFTARTIASADASPYQAVIGALGALQGYRHGGATQRVDMMIQVFESAPDRAAAMRRWLQGGQVLAGFGHHLYPEGDVRARVLLDLLRSQIGDSAALELADEVIRFAGQTVGLYPNIDFALVVLQRAFQLPADAPLTLFALGRAAGWIAHIIEQYEADTMIRPRATYTGRLPS